VRQVQWSLGADTNSFPARKSPLRPAPSRKNNVRTIPARQPKPSGARRLDQLSVGVAKNSALILLPRRLQRKRPRAKRSAVPAIREPRPMRHESFATSGSARTNLCAPARTIICVLYLDFVVLFLSGPSPNGSTQNEFLCPCPLQIPSCIQLGT